MQRVSANAHYPHITTSQIQWDFLILFTYVRTATQLYNYSTALKSVKWASYTGSIGPLSQVHHQILSFQQVLLVGKEDCRQECWHHIPCNCQSARCFLIFWFESKWLKAIVASTLTSTCEYTTFSREDHEGISSASTQQLWTPLGRWLLEVSAGEMLTGEICTCWRKSLKKIQGSVSSISICLAIHISGRSSGKG